LISFSPTAACFSEGEKKAIAALTFMAEAYPAQRFGL
jgi:hypothetical protein